MNNIKIYKKDYIHVYTKIYKSIWHINIRSYNNVIFHINFYLIRYFFISYRKSKFQMRFANRTCIVISIRNRCKCNQPWK